MTTRNYGEFLQDCCSTEEQPTAHVTKAELQQALSGKADTGLTVLKAAYDSKIAALEARIRALEAAVF